MTLLQPVGKMPDPLVVDGFVPCTAEDDIAATRETVLFQRTPDIELVDHLIFSASGHFGFRSAEML
ncbi:MAG: hypothetical protein JHD35_04045 [Sphingopyxis sp.]|nr:hypothetical protein [Sphingopyxis sp.]